MFKSYHMTLCDIMLYFVTSCFVLSSCNMISYYIYISYHIAYYSIICITPYYIMLLATVLYPRTMLICANPNQLIIPHLQGLWWD